MGLLDRVARRLECEDSLAPADAILVLDGGEIGERFVTGLHLLRRGYAPRLLVSHATNGGLACQDAQALAGEDWKKVYWMASDAASTRKESIAARHALKGLGCSSVLVVTSRYHTRRAKEIYSRELAPAGVDVRVIPASVPYFDAQPWWKTRAGRAAILFECAKVLCDRIKFDLPISSGLRWKLKVWAQRSIP